MYIYICIYIYIYPGISPSYPKNLLQINPPNVVFFAEIPGRCQTETEPQVVRGLTGQTKPGYFSTKKKPEKLVSALFSPTHLGCVFLCGVLFFLCCLFILFFCVRSKGVFSLL